MRQPSIVRSRFVRALGSYARILSPLERVLNRETRPLCCAQIVPKICQRYQNISKNIELYRNPECPKNGPYSTKPYYFLPVIFFRRFLHTVKGRAFGSPLARVLNLRASTAEVDPRSCRLRQHCQGRWQDRGPGRCRSQRFKSSIAHHFLFQQLARSHDPDKWFESPHQRVVH